MNFCVLTKMMGHGHWSDSQDSSAWFFPAAVDINSGKDWLESILNIILWEIYIRVLEISNKIIKNIFIVVKHDWKFAKKAL